MGDAFAHALNRQLLGLDLTRRRKPLIPKTPIESSTAFSNQLVLRNFLSGKGLGIGTMKQADGGTTNEH